MSDNPPTPATPGAGAPESVSSRYRFVALAVFALFSILILRDLSNRYPTLAGDIWEHWLICESFHAHGTPELRPEDMPPVYNEAARLGYSPHPPHPYAYAPALDGRMYGVHFWAYAMCGVPAKAYLRWAGKSELAWPGLSNAMWFLLAVGIALFVSKAPLGERFALTGLAVAGSGWKYVAWPGSELFSWAWVLIAVVMYRDKRYGWSALAAGVAALQNPPVIVFGGFAFLAAVWERRWRAAVGTVFGTAVGLIPYAFFQYHFGKPNLIAADFARTAYITWGRTWSQLTDFNQGMLPFVPVLVFASVIGAGLILYRRNVIDLLLLGAAVSIGIGTEVSRNWNSGCEGLQRYLVWMLPLAAGVVVAGFGNGRVLWIVAALGVIVHSALIPIYREAEVLNDGYLSHNKIAKWVLIRYPKLYWAEPEVFVERTRHDDNWPMTPAKYPIAFVRPDGTVSKMLIDGDSVDEVAKVFVVEPAYLEELRAEAAARPRVEPKNPYYFPAPPPPPPGTPPPPPAPVKLVTYPYYVHPPHGAVRVRSSP